MIPLTNWVAAFGLAISCVLLLLAAWGEPEFRTKRALLAAAGLAYLLASFWLTPEFRQDHRVQLAGGFLRLPGARHAGLVARRDGRIGWW